ncbi:MAG: POTRA domain-containing protein [Steroidobacteraceae bacterium]
MDKHLRRAGAWFTTTLGVSLGACLLWQTALAQAPAAPPGGAPPAGAQQAEANPPVIDSVSYSGNKKISSAELAKGCLVKVGVKINKEMVGAEIDRVVALYKKAGYDLAISPDIQHPADGHVTVTFKIDENGKGGNAGPAAGGPPGGGGGAGGPPPGAPPAGN